MVAVPSGVPADVWDSELLRMGGHFLQSRPWQRVQQALGYGILTGSGSGWCWAGAVRAGRFPRYLYLPYGPAGTPDASLASIADAARAAELDFARMEPLERPSVAALRRVCAREARPVQPRWTWVLDITVDEERLRAGLSGGHRGSINAAERRGLTFRASADTGDVAGFLELQRRSAGRGRYGGQSGRYYRAVVETLVPQGCASLYFADSNGRAVAAAIAFDFGATRYYAHAVSDPVEGRRLGAAAPLVWRMIRDARADAKSEFDFWGVAPPGLEHHPWAGFTRFKQAFGGRLVERPGAWEIPVRSVRHRTFRLLQLLRRS